jgi:hypothetical protein
LQVLATTFAVAKPPAPIQQTVSESLQQRQRH